MCFFPANKKFATPVLPETSAGNPASPGRLQGSEPCLSAEPHHPAGSTGLKQHRQAGTGTWPCWTPGSLALPGAVAAVTNFGRRLVVARRVHGWPESLTVCLCLSLPFRWLRVLYQISLKSTVWMMALIIPSREFWWLDLGSCGLWCHRDPSMES